MSEKHKTIHYTWIDSDISILPCMYSEKMLKVADIQMLKESVAKKHGVDKDELFVCDIWKSTLHKELRRHDCVDHINKETGNCNHPMFITNPT